MRPVSYSSRGPVDLTRVARHGWSHSRSDPACDPQAVAQLMLSVVLGFIAQRSLAGGADISAHAAAVSALAFPAPPGA